MARRRVRAVDTWKLKDWYTVYAPRVWGEKEVASTAADDPRKLIGRTVEVPASDMTGNIGHAQYLLKLKISKVVGHKAYTEFLGHEVDYSFIKRFTRRHTSKVESVFDVTSKDGVKVHVKSIVWTATRVSDSQAADIREIVRKNVEDFSKSNEKDELLKGFILGDVSRTIADSVKKIAPVRRVEIAKSVAPVSLLGVEEESPPEEGS